MRRMLPVTALLLTSLALGACTSGATPAPSSAAPSVAPSVAPTIGPSNIPSVAPSASPGACAKDSLKLTTAAKLTIGTDNPAYPPYYDIPASATKPWELGDPTDGKGFESAFAYALAAKLGFARTDVTWVVVPFDNSFAPGTKKFDIDINQVSYKPERAASADLSDGYYNLNQSIVAIKTNSLAAVTSIAGMKGFKFGAQLGTTSLDTINTVIAPTAAAKVYTTNDDAIAGLKAKQIDGLVVDLPTAFYVTGAPQVENSVIVGQFAAPTGADAEHFSVVLDKGSTLTSCVNAAIGAMKSDGSLDAITKEWLSDKASAPVLQP